MKALRSLRPLWAVCLLLLTLALRPTTAEGAPTTQWLKITGTSTASGVCSVTIESFALHDPGPGAEAAQSLTNVPIPASSTPANSAILIRDALDADLAADYTVSIPFGDPNVVRIDRSTGSFSMSLIEDLPTQVIETFTTPLPLLGLPGASALGLILSAGAAFVLFRRRRTATR